MQNRINIYAALAISIIVTIIMAAVVFFVGWLESTQSNGNYNSDFEVFIAISAILLVLALFFGLPAILNSRYGWKTVVVTLIFQSIFLFFAVTAIAAIVNMNTPSSPPSPYIGTPSLD